MLKPANPVGWGLYGAVCSPPGPRAFYDPFGVMFGCELEEIQPMIALIGAGFDALDHLKIELSLAGNQRATNGL